ncbi:hypothetical protein J1605_007159 [Eschrichtius robustus]|uniref:Uncharacterized protein n=1 Tax=Eschrichtius robustus TaxID=9764 RepID=A0AB34H297_ESCRO|nr:hypothetical protein J1605_007159 [Eschrichtius robustus]
MKLRASLVAQWLRVCPRMQATRVRALVWEDPTCRGAAGPVSHNCWACASGACAPQQERPRWPLDEKKVKLEVGRPVGKLLQHCLQEKMMAKQMESQEQWRDILVMVTELGQ